MKWLSQASTAVDAVDVELFPLFFVMSGGFFVSFLPLLRR